MSPPTALSVSTDSGDGEYAIDGNLAADSKWTSDGLTPPHWLQLDLGLARQITGFVVHHAGAGGEPSYYNTRTFQIETSTEDPDVRQVDAMLFNADSADSTSLVYYEPRPIRHVRLLITDPGIDNYARIPEFEVYVAALPGDYDGDGRVDLDDFGLLLFCWQGPDASYLPEHFCLKGDADDDADLDLVDFATFQRLFAP